MKRFLCLGAVLFLCVFWAGCGEVFRPIIIPNPPQFPNPAAAHTVVTLSNNGITTTGPGVPPEDPLPGSAMVIDVSGDTVVSIKPIGLNPVHAVLQSAADALVVNQSVTGLPTPPSGCVETIDNQDFNVCPTLTKLQFSGTTIGTTSTLTLPPNSAANFVATTESSQAYISLPNLFLDPINHPLDGSVAVVDTTNYNITTEVMVGSNPVAMAETPDGTKLYVANQGDGTLSAFNTKPSISTRTICDPTGKVCPPPLSSAPVWISARSDSEEVFVLESNGTLAYLNTGLTGSDTFTETGITVPLPVPVTSANMWYDTILNRLYIPGGSQLVIVDVSQSVPTVMATIDIPAFAILPTGTTPATAVAVTSLPDGSRAYVASFAVLPTDFTVSSVSGDGTTATYAYTLTGGHDLTPGVTVSVTGTGPDFDGTFLVAAVVSGTSACPRSCFQAPNATSGTGTAGTGTGSNIFPQVTVVNTTSNTIKVSSVGIPGFPDATNSNYAGGIYYVPACASTRFRFTMAAAGDSSRAYLGSCDGGNVNIVYTSTDTYAENASAPGSSRQPISPSNQNPPQNPTFLFAGP
jgi:YVTN family beta-propeller protein